MASIAAALTVLAAELAVRAAGHAPWRTLAPRLGEPVQYEPDPELGWRNKPGSYRAPPYTAGAPEIHSTYLADGSRRTGDGPHAGPVVALLGGSFVQGWGLSDPETLAWRLQEALPELTIRNLGVGGYGTYQSLLRLQREFAGASPPSLVVYGLIPVHEVRNVASASWLYSLARTSRSGVAAVPYVSIDAEKALVLHPPARYPAWPLRGQLALVALLQDRFAQVGAAARTRQAEGATRRLLLRMDRLVERGGAELAVAFLSAPPTGVSPYKDGASVRSFRGGAYRGFLERRGISFADCSRALSLDLLIPGEGHPNAEQNRLWAECLLEQLDALEALRAAGAQSGARPATR